MTNSNETVTDTKVETDASHDDNSPTVDEAAKATSKVVTALFVTGRVLTAAPRGLYRGVVATPHAVVTGAENTKTAVHNANTRRLGRKAIATREGEAVRRMKEEAAKASS